jgi:DNA sulfur modification protein DndD
MKLTRAEFSHFRILDNVKAEFETGKTNIFFVNGFNGRGKTSFQDALYWCLYDRAPDDGLANKSALRNAKGLVVTVSVTLEFQLDDEEFESVEIRRIAEVTEEGRKQRIVNSRLVVLGRNPGESSFTEPIANEIEWLHKRFAPGLQQFFLFDGESLERFFVNTTKEKIRDAVREIAGVEAFDAIEEKLGVTINDWRRQLAKDSQKDSAPAMEIKRQKYEAAVKAAQFDIHKADEQVMRLDTELEELDKYLARFGNNAALLKEESEINVELQALKAELLELRVNQHDEILSNGIEFALDSRFSQEVLSQQQDAIENDEYPPQFSENLMHKILELGRCVCGEEVLPGSEKHRVLEGLILEHRDVDSIGQDLQALCKYVEYWPQQASRQFQVFNEQSKRIASVSRQVDQKELKLAELQAQLSGADRDEQLLKIDRKKRIPYEISEANSERSKALEQRDWALHEVSTLNKDLEKLVKSSSTNQKFTLLIAKANGLIDAAKLAHRTAVESVRRELEDAVDEEFRVIKDGLFKTQITDTFEVRTIKADGDIIQLSSGENMMKAYVFALALRKVIGFKFPLVVDTPFGRLDSQNRTRLVDMITRLNSSKVLENGNQVIFLMHDLEYTPAIREAFKPNNPVEMYLAYQDADEISKLSPGIDPEWLKTDAWKEVKK